MAEGLVLDLFKGWTPEMVEMAQYIGKSDFEKRSEGMQRYFSTLTQEDLDARNERTSEATRAAWRSLSFEEKEERLSKSVYTDKLKEAHNKYFAEEPEDLKSGRMLSMALGRHRGITESEIFLRTFLDQLRPGIWAFNGCGEKGIVIDGNIPDFVNVRDGSKVIDLFDRKFHREEEVESRKSLFKRFGIDCLIIWDYELTLREVESRLLEEGV